MARIRSIKPELASDVKLAKLHADVRWTFVLCISQADDCGLLPGTARALLGILYPNSRDVTEAKLERWLDALVAAGMLARLDTVDGADLLVVTNWARHQTVAKPHFSVLSRALVRNASPNNSRMSPEQVTETARTIQERIAERFRNHSGTTTGSVLDRTVDRGPWTVDHGVVQGDSPVVEDLPPRATATATAGSLDPKPQRPVPYPYRRGAA